MNGENLKKYEESWDFKIPPHMSVVIRVDGKNFSKLTSHLLKPFDNVFHSIMDTTAVDVAKEIDGCKLVYTQSDEATFILNNVDNQTLYFNGRIQKIVSIVAANMSIKFYKNFMQFILQYQDKVQENIEMYSSNEIEAVNNRISSLWKFLDEDPIFDARVFVMPVEEEIEILINRQNNSINNSVLSAAQHYLGKKVCEGLKKNDMIIRLANEGHNIDDILTDRDRLGAIAFRDDEEGWISQIATRFSREELECNTKN